VVGDKAKGERAMSQASAGGGGRTEVERRLIQRSLQDEEFRQRLLDDPKAVVEQELGSRLPESVEVRVVQESARTIYLVIPSASAIGGGVELSDQELEGVAGGGTWEAGGGPAGDPGAGRCSPVARYSELELVFR
jgi:hypothetical protein